MTNNLGDEAEAFFRVGEEGTYEGGPASIAPLAVCEEPAEVWDVASAAEWLDRRRRLQRVVASVVGGLTAGLVVLSLCLLAARASRTRDAGPLPRPAPAPHLATAPVLPAVTAVAVQPAMPILTLPAETKSAAEPPPSPSPLRHLEPATRTRSNAAVPRQRPSMDQRRQRPAVALPRGGAELPAISGAATARHDPPTAFFPN